MTNRLTLPVLNSYLEIMAISSLISKSRLPWIKKNNYILWNTNITIKCINHLQIITKYTNSTISKFTIQNKINNGCRPCTSAQPSDYSHQVKVFIISTVVTEKSDCPLNKNKISLLQMSPHIFIGFMQLCCALILQCGLTLSKCFALQDFN